MASYSRLLLSGSVSGTLIPVAASATPGTLLHTAVDGVTNFDEVYAFASNVTPAVAHLTIEWGGGSDPDDHLVHDYEIPANSAPIPILVGQVLNGALEVRAFSDVPGAINIGGYVNRIQ